MLHFIRFGSILFLVILFSGCTKFFEPEPAQDAVAVFDQLWTTFEQEYAPFAERGVDWQAAYQDYRPQVNDLMSDEALFNLLSTMLARLDDGHVTLTAPGRPLFNSNARRNTLLEDELFSLPLVRTYLQPGFQQGEENSYTFGKIRNENIGYIHFEHVGENFYQLNTFLNAFPNAAAYIIDLRHNQGGDFTYCFSEIGRLTNQSRYVFSSQTKNGPKATDYTPWHQWFIHPSGEYVNKPIVVLADRYTISAGERALMAFKTLPNVTLVGDTSSGAHGTMIGRELANGWFYSLVPQKVIMPDGKSYEGIGIAPDYYIKNQLTDMQSGIDATLDYAIDLVN